MIISSVKNATMTVFPAIVPATLFGAAAFTNIGMAAVPVVTTALSAKTAFNKEAHPVAKWAARAAIVTSVAALGCAVTAFGAGMGGSTMGLVIGAMLLNKASTHCLAAMMGASQNMGAKGLIGGAAAYAGSFGVYAGTEVTTALTVASASYFGLSFLGSHGLAHAAGGALVKYFNRRATQQQQPAQDVQRGQTAERPQGVRMKGLQDLIRQNKGTGADAPTLSGHGDDANKPSAPSVNKRPQITFPRPPRG